MRAVTVIADDLSGAADCGAAFAAAGLSTFVAFGRASAPLAAQVLSIDTDSRRLSGVEAAQRTAEAVRHAYATGTDTVYKKIDSTLRGHVGLELAATLAAAAAALPDKTPVLLVSPAFPSSARIVRGGSVFVGGVPLGETEIWRQSGTQGPCDLVAMLRQAGLIVESLSAQALRSDLRCLDQLAHGGAQAIACDAEDEADLRTIADAGARSERAVIWAGSAGLARHLPAALELRPHGPSSPSWKTTTTDGPIVLLVGSRSKVSREQARCVAADTRVESATVSATLLAERVDTAAWTDVVARLARALGAGRDVLLTLTDEATSAPDAAVAAGLGQLCASLPRIGGLIATGADTARAALLARGASGLHLVGEVEPGVPMGLADGPQPLRVITKAGAFGTPHTLARCRAALHSG